MGETRNTINFLYDLYQNVDLTELTVYVVLSAVIHYFYTSANLAPLGILFQFAMGVYYTTKELYDGNLTLAGSYALTFLSLSVTYRRLKDTGIARSAYHLRLISLMLESNLTYAEFKGDNWLTGQITLFIFTIVNNGMIIAFENVQARTRNLMLLSESGILINGLLSMILYLLGANGLVGKIANAIIEVKTDSENGSFMLYGLIQTSIVWLNSYSQQNNMMFLSNVTAFLLDHEPYATSVFWLLCIAIFSTLYSTTLQRDLRVQPLFALPIAIVQVVLSAQNLVSEPISTFFQILSGDNVVRNKKDDTPEQLLLLVPLFTFKFAISICTSFLDVMFFAFVIFLYMVLFAPKFLQNAYRVNKIISQGIKINLPESMKE